MLSAKDVVKAHKVLSGVVVDTTLEYDHYLSENTKQDLSSKGECTTKSALFKVRGALF